jgi:hypothetical protein
MHHIHDYYIDLDKDEQILKLGQGSTILNVFPGDGLYTAHLVVLENNDDPKIPVTIVIRGSGDSVDMNTGIQYIGTIFRDVPDAPRIRHIGYIDPELNEDK